MGEESDGVDVALTAVYRTDRQRAKRPGARRQALLQRTHVIPPSTFVLHQVFPPKIFAR